MNNYGNFNLKRERRKRKIMVAVVCIIIILLAVVFYVGITAGTGGEDMERISSAVRENTQLKVEISELESEIERLNQEIDDLNARLAASPAETVEQYASNGASTPAPSPENALSPRAGIR